MYYKTGDVCRKIFNVDGFDFQLRVKKRAYSVEIVVLDHEGNSIDGDQFLTRTIYTQL